MEPGWQTIGRMKAVAIQNHVSSYEKTLSGMPTYREWRLLKTDWVRLFKMTPNWFNIFQSLLWRLQGSTGLHTLFAINCSFAENFVWFAVTVIRNKRYPQFWWLTGGYSILCCSVVLFIISKGLHKVNFGSNNCILNQQRLLLISKRSRWYIGLPLILSVPNDRAHYYR